MKRYEAEKAEGGFTKGTAHLEKIINELESGVYAIFKDGQLKCTIEIVKDANYPIVGVMGSDEIFKASEFLLEFLKEPGYHEIVPAKNIFLNLANGNYLYQLLDDCHTAIAKSKIDTEEYTELSRRLIEQKQLLLANDPGCPFLPEETTPENKAGMMKVIQISNALHFTTGVITYLAGYSKKRKDMFISLRPDIRHALLFEPDSAELQKAFNFIEQQYRGEATVEIVDYFPKKS